MIPGFLAHLWQSTLFGGAAWLLTLVLRRNPARVRYSVWLIASAKFLIPFSLLVGLGTFVPWRTAAPPPETGWVAVAEQVRPLVTIPAVGADVALAANATNRAYFTWVALFLWFCGFAAISICWATRWRRIGELRRRATPLRMRKGIESAIPIMSAPGLVEPGVFGVFRPILLLPEGIGARLNEAELEAILAHELCHARRRDNLTATIHMVVQAVFWFHPLVWWLGARLVDERERACDEEVLRLGNRPQVYAAGILNVCKLYMELQLTCVSGVTGADLKKRIETIMKNRVVRRLDLRRKLVLTLAGLASVAIPFAMGVVNSPVTLAQSTATGGKKSEFDVASIKPFPHPVTGNSMSYNAWRTMARSSVHGQFSLVMVSLKGLLLAAYDVKDFQVVGGPPWMDNEGYDVVAKAGSNVSYAQMMPMIQSLLADRFKLALHREARDLPVYELSAAKGGLRVVPTQQGSCTPPDSITSPPPLGTKICGGIAMRRYELTGYSISMAEFSANLDSILGRPVIDKTGVKERFDVDLKFDPCSTPEGLGGSSAPHGGGGCADFSSYPSIPTALQEQLGLRLQSARGPVEVLVVDHAEKPTAN